MSIDNYVDNYLLPNSLRCISDFFDDNNIENMACRLELDQLSQIEGSFIVSLKAQQYPLVIVTNVSTDYFEMFSPTLNRIVKMPKSQFVNLWEGVVLIGEKSSKTKEDKLASYVLKQILWLIDSNRIWIILVLLLLSFTVIFMQDSIVKNLCYIINIIGIVTSVIIIIKAYFNKRIMQQFCQYGKTVSCDDVLNAAGAKVLGWVSLGELSLAYFASMLFLGVFLDLKNELQLKYFLGSIALIFVVYSLVWQVFNRKWCTLCIVIDVLLAADFIVLMLFNNSLNPTSRVEFSDFIIFSTLFTIILLSIKQYISLLVDNNTMSTYKRKNELLVSSSDTFWAILSNQQQVPRSVNEASLLSNNINSKHTITVVMNPSCTKCAKVHATLTTLTDYKINLAIFVGRGDNNSYDAALKIISIGLTSGWEQMNIAVQEWYKNRNLSNIDLHSKAKSILDGQMRYCVDINIEGTPTIIINNKCLPEIYDISDLKIIL